MQTWSLVKRTNQALLLLYPHALYSASHMVGAENGRCSPVQLRLKGFLKRKVSFYGVKK